MQLKSSTNQSSRTHPTISRLRELFDYDPHSGLMTRKTLVGNGTAVGSVVGCKSTNKYLRVQIDGASYMCHRIAWAIYYGDWPKMHIDHIDRDKFNNSILNLREANSSENQHNKTTPRQNSTGHRGVFSFRNGGKFYAEITKNGKTMFLGTFDDPQSASVAFEDTAKRLQGEFYLASGEQPFREGQEVISAAAHLRRIEAAVENYFKNEFGFSVYRSSGLAHRLVLCSTSPLAPLLADLAAERTAKEAAGRERDEARAKCERLFEQRDKEGEFAMANFIRAESVTADRDRLAEQVAGLRSALEPFADVCDAEPMKHVRDEQVLELSTRAEVRVSEKLRGSHFRAADRALHSTKGGEDVG